MKARRNNQPLIVRRMYGCQQKGALKVWVTCQRHQNQGGAEI